MITLGVMADIHCQLDWVKKHGRHCPVGGVHDGCFQMTDRGKTTCHEYRGHHPTGSLETQTEKEERKLSGNFLLPPLPVLVEGEKQLPSDADRSGFHPCAVVPPFPTMLVHNHP